MDNALSKFAGTTIEFNARLLFAVVGLIIATITLRFANPFTFQSTLTLRSFLSLLALLVFIAMLVYTFYQLVNQIQLSWLDRSACIALSRSIFLGSFLLGMFSLSLSGQTGGLSDIAYVLDIFAIFGFLFCVTERSSQDAIPANEQIQNQQNQQSLPEPNKAMQSEGKIEPAHNLQHKSGSPGIISLPSRSTRGTVEAREPPLLFVNDPLFALPVLEDPSQPIREPRYRLFSLQKPKEQSVDNEDACAISHDQKAFALSDGAGGSAIAARPWASLLAKQWLKSPFIYEHEQVIQPQLLGNWLKEPSARWANWVQHSWFPAVNERNLRMGERTESPEVVAGMIQQGAAATFLGVRLSESRQGWFATAIGDTCLFVVSRQQQGEPIIEPIMPLTNSADFNLTPPLLYSSIRSDLLVPATNKIQGRFRKYQPGDMMLLLATDALARWIIAQQEEKPLQKGWLRLLTMRTADEFHEFIRNLQKRSLLEIDDTTLLIIYLPTQAGQTALYEGRNRS